MFSWKPFHWNISLFVLNTLPWNHKLTSFQVWKKVPSLKIRLLHAAQRLKDVLERARFVFFRIIAIVEKKIYISLSLLEVQVI